MHVRFIGSGDAFGSGGRFNTCFHLVGSTTNVLIDCGASSLIAMKQQGIERNPVEAIFFTHFHADHFGGIPFFILDAQFFSKRTAPLTLVGPRGLADWYGRVMETAFPGSSTAGRRFELALVEVEAGRHVRVAGVEAVAFQVNHGNPGGPFLAYRLRAEGISVAYTGDTEWTDALIEARRDVDLFIAEAYFYDKKVALHLDVQSLERHLPEIRPKRLILTHMSDELIRRLADVTHETAHDGMVVELRSA
jgi:ribonuclease BN (tRNA processing enzyme)